METKTSGDNERWFRLPLGIALSTLFLLLAIKVDMEHYTLGVFLSSSLGLMALVGLLDSIVRIRLERYKRDKDSKGEIIRDFEKVLPRYSWGMTTTFTLLFLWLISGGIWSSLPLWVIHLSISWVVFFMVYFLKSLLSHVRHVDK